MMAIAHCKHCVIALTIASIVALLIYYTATLARFSDTSVLRSRATVLDTHTARKREQILFTNTTSTPIVESPNVILPASVNSRNETFKCRRAVLMKMSFPVCYYTPKTDGVITGRMARGKYYESGEVSRFLQLLRHDQRLQLVDIGANIGLYSLPAARVTQVLAVEPNWRSVSRLAKAVNLGAVGSNITLVHNAVSDVRATVHMGVNPGNQGHAFLTKSTDCKASSRLLPCRNIAPTRTILLNDLLPLMRRNASLLKVDVEGHEVHVFTDSSAGQFFDEIDVPLVFMEWFLTKWRRTSQIRGLLKFFYSRNYAVYNLRNRKLSNRNYRGWPGNVLLKKQTNPLRF